MTSLHIAHGVDDFDGWLATFTAFAAFRTDGGVTSTTVRRSLDDPGAVAIDLEFATADQARALLARLEQEIWPSSPHLGGEAPVAVLYETVDLSG